jgi:transposase
LDIPEVRVLRTEINADNEFVLTVESTRKSATCRICGQTITLRHGSDEIRTLRHLPILGRPVFLRIRPERFRCTSCHGQPTTTQQLDWYDPNGLHTKAFEQQLIVGLVNSTIADLVAKEDVRYDALLGILDRWVAKTVDWEAIESFSTLGVDEIALTKGQRNFVAVLSAATDSGHLQLLAVLPDRLKTTLVAWLKFMPVHRHGSEM